MFDPIPTTKPATPDPDALMGDHPGHSYPHPPTLRSVAHAAGHVLRGPLWMAAGILATAATLGGPGCVGTNGAGPAMTARADLSVKEVARVVAVRPMGAGMGGAGTSPGELAISASVEIRWPAK